MKAMSLKQQETKERQDIRNKMSAQEQLQKLDAKLGKGVGAQRERKRLQKIIESQKEKHD